MVVYWMMFLLPCLALFSPHRAEPRLARGVWIVTGAVFTAVIGLRYEVGADWSTYSQYYDRTVDVSFSEALGWNDPAYLVLNWLSAQIGGGVYLVNLVCALLVVTGVISFARRQPLPWLAVLVAVPYLMIVVSMGYTRQSAALGLELLALIALADRRVFRFTVLIVLGALFHKSAVLLLPLAALASAHHRLWTWFWVMLTSVTMATLVLYEYQEALWRTYMQAGITSEGAGIRVAMNAIPSVAFLFFRTKLAQNRFERRLWSWIALFSLLSVPFVGISSTAVDRVALYFMPIQMLVFSRLHRIFDSRLYRSEIVLGVSAGYAAVLWVWLSYATHATSWLPYQFYPLVGL